MRCWLIVPMAVSRTTTISKAVNRRRCYRLTGRAPLFLDAHANPSWFLDALLVTWNRSPQSQGGQKANERDAKVARLYPWRVTDTAAAAGGVWRSSPLPGCRASNIPRYRSTVYRFRNRVQGLRRCYVANAQYTKAVDRRVRGARLWCDQLRQPKFCYCLSSQERGNVRYCLFSS